ncbi:hypothetical protein I5M27_12925 [Adhaeribacter sp. BT258]|uniref:Uncharacterized protein n=1 Tax=Adhaeribacter terrigena TaxID=2793070 RepID=A0ABS1C3B6_9BACT|nr:hypothetical protein [Adhaeribacter terrigena]MBK0403891.1 hypothetical protein [Adhaeribacter terrigena]
MKHNSNQAAVTARPTLPSITDPELISFAVAADHAKLAGIISDEEHLDYLNALLVCRSPYSGFIGFEGNIREINLKILSNVPADDTHAPFKFSVLHETVDVRPIFECIENCNTAGIVAMLDTVMYDLIKTSNPDDFTDSFKENLWLLRELRNAFMESTGGEVMDSWRRCSKMAKQAAENRLQSDWRWLENRLNTYKL